MIDGVTIKQVTNTKLLGIVIDQHLTWSQHIILIANKVDKNVGVLQNLHTYLPPKTLLGLYNSMLNPF